MFRRYAEAERQYWLQTKERGKSRFIWREVLGTQIIGVIVVFATEALEDHTHPFSFRSTFSLILITLPIALLGGYLSGSGRWKDFEKKYSE